MDDIIYIKPFNSTLSFTYVKIFQTNIFFEISKIKRDIFKTTVLVNVIYSCGIYVKVPLEEEKVVLNSNYILVNSLLWKPFSTDLLAPADCK